MKKLGLKTLALIGSSLVLVTTSCGSSSSGGETPVAPVSFSFFIKLKKKGIGVTNLFVGDKDVLVPVANMSDAGRIYTFESSNPDAVYISEDGDINVKKVPEDGKKVTLVVTEEISGAFASREFVINPKAEDASGGKDYSTNNAEKTEIIGKLEEYAMKNFLTGIPIFENGGWVRYHDRVELGSKTYIPGYGFGLLREGRLKYDNTKVPERYQSYLCNAMSENPNTVNAWEAQGSQVSDLNSYITSSYWGTKLNATKTDYEWHPILALNEEPITLEEENPLKAYKTWRVYLRTGVDRNGSLIPASEGGIYYRTSSANGFNNRAVQAEDYLFTFKLMLQGRTKLLRGTELATDTSYGFRGANQFNSQSANWDPATIDYQFDKWSSEGKLGVKLAWEDEDRVDPDSGLNLKNKPYLEFNFINAIDAFTAKYVLSSNLYSPLPQEFLSSIVSDDWTLAGKKYGTAYNKKIQDRVLAVGPYYLDHWDDEIVFVRNDGWFENNSTTYRIPGVYISKVNQEADAQFNTFVTGVLDSTGIPKSKIAYAGTGNDYQTVGDSTFKLNVNSCSEARWQELFGPTGTVKPGQSPRNNKVWMSNKAFLNGLFWSIDRNTYAANRGVQPSVNYFANTYLSDPQTKDPTAIKVYNYTDAHKRALESFGISSTDKTYGYNTGLAKAYFRAAVSDMIADGSIVQGTAANPTVLDIDVWWMQVSDVSEYGNDIAYYFESTFNAACLAMGFKLQVNNQAVVNWEDVYDKHLQVGDFDLGFGAISGNTLNPLNFLEVLKSDNSSGFTLNWGADTSKVDAKDPILYDDQTWSFDALWAAGDHGTIVQDGTETKPVESSYLALPTKDEEGLLPCDKARLAGGGYVRIVTNFAAVKDLDVDVTKIVLSAAGSDGLEITGDDIKKVFEDDKLKEVYFYVSSEQAEAIDAAIAGTQSVAALLTALYNRYYNDWDNPEYLEEKDRLEHLFSVAAYADNNNGGYWSLEVYFNFSIAGGSPIENFFTPDRSESSVSTRSGLRMSFLNK